MPTEITTVDPQDAVNLVRERLESAGWITVFSSPTDVAHLKFEGDVPMEVRYDPKAPVPMQFQWKLELKKEPMEFFIDFGLQLETLVAILAECASQTTEDNYRGVVAAVAHLLPSVHYLENGNTLRQLDLVGWV